MAPATGNSTFTRLKHDEKHTEFSNFYSRSVRFTETVEPGDKTAVRFTWAFNNDDINKNTTVRFTWFQPWFQNSFETFETTSGGSF